MLQRQVIGTNKPKFPEDHTDKMWAPAATLQTKYGQQNLMHVNKVKKYKYNFSHRYVQFVTNNCAYAHMQIHICTLTHKYNALYCIVYHPSRFNL